MSVRKAHNSGRNHLRNVVDYYQRKEMECLRRQHADRKPEIGHEKAQSVIDSITSSYAAEGQANPMLQQAGPGFPPPLPGFPGEWRRCLTFMFTNFDAGMPPPPFGMQGPGPNGAMPPGGRGMPPFPPPFANGQPPPNMPNGMPFPPPGGFPANMPFPPPGAPGGFPPPGQHGPPGGLHTPSPGPGYNQQGPPGFNMNGPPGMGDSRR